jgi:hypothetical protein
MAGGPVFSAQGASLSRNHSVGDAQIISRNLGVWNGLGTGCGRQAAKRPVFHIFGHRIGQSCRVSRHHQPNRYYAHYAVHAHCACQLSVVIFLFYRRRHTECWPSGYSGTSVEHFVAYQNSDVEGRFNGGRPVREGRSGRWFTAKPFRPETVVGNRLWAIEGGGSPIPASLHANRRLKFGSPEYVNAPRCGTCDMDIAMVGRLYPALMPAHEGAIRVAARSPRRADTTKDHSPGLVVFVSQEVGVLLPQPEYVKALKNAAPIPEEIPANEEFQEGAAVQVLVNRYERDPTARQHCIKYYGTTCIACGVSLAQRYGPEANGLIHVHHLTPLANLGARSIVDPVRDLRPVCPNCHAVIHLTHPPRAIEEVRAMLCEQGSAHKKT